MGGGYKRRPCLLSSLMAAAMGLRLIKSLPLAEAEFKKCCQVNTQRRTSEALHGGQNNSQMQSLHIKAMECIHIAADCKKQMKGMNERKSTFQNIELPVLITLISKAYECAMYIQTLLGE